MPKTASISGPTEDQIKPDLTQEHGDNGPSKEDRLFFAGQIRAADEACKAARDHRKKVRQAATNRGITLKILDWVMQVAEQEDGTILDDLKEFKACAQDFDLPIGFQMDLFGSPAPENGLSKDEALDKKAYTSGYQRGVAGLNPDDQAYPPALPEGQKHMEGWNDGQQVNFEKLRKLNDDIAAEKAAKEAKKQSKADDAGEDTRH